MKLLRSSFKPIAMLAGVAALSIAILLSTGCPKHSTTNAVTEIRITRQYGLPYLALTIVEQQHLLEKAAHAQGLGDVKVTWLQLGSGAASNDALLSGSVDFVTMGAPPMINVWAKTNGHVKAVASLGSAPNFLTTTNPNIKSIRDFSKNDRIALAAVKVSLQAIILQMAAAKALGDAHYADLDALTVSMKPPDAMAAMLSGRSEITAHFSSDPFAYRELADPHIHEVLNSYDVLGGPHASVVIVTTQEYHDSHPLVTKALLAALDEADKVIRDDKPSAARAMIASGDTNEPLDTILQHLNDPRFIFRTEASDITQFSDFMFKTGAINHKPADWKELFFPDAFSRTAG